MASESSCRCMKTSGPRSLCSVHRVTELKRHILGNITIPESQTTTHFSDELVPETSAYVDRNEVRKCTDRMYLLVATRQACCKYRGCSNKPYFPLRRPDDGAGDWTTSCRPPTCAASAVEDIACMPSVSQHGWMENSHTICISACVSCHKRRLQRRLSAVGGKCTLLR